MKIKALTKEQILLSIDRLTRFKNTEVKYLRVFREIILHNLISPNFNKHELEIMDYESIKKYAQEILNYSIKLIAGENSSDHSLNKKLYNYEKSVYKQDKETEKLLNNQIDYLSVVQFISESSPQNLKWLKAMAENTNIKEERKKQKFKYPIELLVLVEGATEETLLPCFADICDFNFDENGIYIIPAGGKNQVVKLYYDYRETLNIPIFVLFDKDGIQNAQEIKPKLRTIDKIHIISCGEFEDALNKDLVSKALKYELENISEMNIDFAEEPGHRVKYLEEIFKNRGMHEFKKVEFSQIIRENITSKDDLTPEIEQIIEEIKSLK